VKSLSIGTVLLTGVLTYTLAAAAYANPADVVDLRVGQHEGNTRVVLDLDRRTGHTVSVSEDGRSLVITLPDAIWKAGSFRRKHAKGLVSGYQYGRDSDGVTQLILTTHEPVSLARQFKLDRGAAKKSIRQRLVFDLSATKPEIIEIAQQKTETLGASLALLTGPGEDVAQLQRRRPTIEPIRQHAMPGRATGQPYYTTVPPRAVAQQMQPPRQTQPMQQQQPLIPPPVQSDEGLRLIPKLEYWWSNPSKRDATTAAHITAATIGHIAFGAALGYKGPTEDYVASLMYATGDGDFTGTSSSGSTGAGDIETTYLDMELDIKNKLVGTPLDLSYGGRWLRESSKANFANTGLTFGATGTNKLETTTDYFIGHVGAEISSPMSSTTNDRLYTNIKLGLGYWFREVGNRRGTAFPDDDDLLAMLDLRVGYEVFGGGNFSGQINYRASFLTLDGLLEDFKILHGPGASFTYKF